MSEAPFVSVLMPIRNEADFIARSLSAALAQDYAPERFEVLVIDGQSSDDTRAIVMQTIASRPEISARLIDNPARIVAAALNAGLREASGAIIVRVDGHTVIAPDYVRQCVAALARTGADNVGGPMTAVGSNPLGAAIALATSSPFGVGGARFHYSNTEEWVDTVYMGAWPREVFARIGSFDEAFVRNQDDEFNYRLLGAGGKILLSPAIRSEYANRGTLGALWRQYFGYGFYKVLVMRKHPRQMRPRQFAPPLLAGSLLLGALLSPFSRWIRALFVGLAALYALANLAASWRIASRHGRLHLRRLPVVFAVLHLSYGFGFLIGVARFALTPGPAPGERGVKRPRPSAPDDASTSSKRRQEVP